MDMLKLYMAFAKINFISQMEYRLDYFFRMVSKILGWGTGFIMIFILLNQFNTLGEWNTYEVIFLYALHILTYSIAATFVMGPFSNLEKNIRSGEFDEVLTRPVNPLFYYVFRKVSAGYTSNYILCIGLFMICFNQLDITLNVTQLIVFIITIIGGSLIQGAAFMIMCIPAFWVVKSKSIFRLFYQSLSDFSQYPLSIYNKSIQGILTFVFPYAFINFYPSQYFLEKTDGVFFHPSFMFLTPLLGVLLILVAYIFWLIGINNYKSTGS
ncbi:ABC-2 type transport system permease protein [Natranaerovirga hydrolytica]|uniref:ABC-2 type transport system permease protein n=1 Tax=Natranaerovirga hydrolytica TaxID=680378 RepID=A0A4V2Q083_9FIRM|nr:ABC-2 family transporter protein [Natranaerovirga hydrolytica]TCK92751.1 ABC-2 type transport system permease protein [Natranaerovirga hydrolytica]